MTHKDLIHKGITYKFDHLIQSTHSFVWAGPTGDEENYQAWVRYSSHCYSEAIAADDLTSDDLVVEQTPLRVFCPIRFAETTRLVEIVGAMLARPTTRVSLTNVGNCHVYQLFVRDGAQNRYCIFFNVKMSKVQPVDGACIYLDFHIESAYIKDHRVGVVRACPLGTVAYMTKTGQR